MKVVYFAWVRERIGVPYEELSEAVETVQDAVDVLAARSPAHSAAFSERDVLRYALDQVLVQPETPVKNARELAIFPPMTGG